MATDLYSFETVQDYIGREIGVSAWFSIDQFRINDFAKCTNDQQWIHVNFERARKESPYGTTIAHGFLTLSLLPYLQEQIGLIPNDISQAVNYGIDKLRFIAPVKAGKRIRSRVVLLSVENKGEGKLLKAQNTVEIEGEEKPALVAELLFVLYPKKVS